MLFLTHTESDGRVVAHVGFDDRQKAKCIGFRWDCVKKHWYTYDQSVAARVTMTSFAAAEKDYRRVVSSRSRHMRGFKQQLKPLRHYLSRTGWKVK